MAEGRCGGGGSQDLTNTIELEGLNSSTGIVTNLLGKTRELIELTTNDGDCTIRILAGTGLHDRYGVPLTSMSITPLTTYPDPPPETTVVFGYEFQPAGARFTPKLRITFKYDLSLLPEDTDPTILKIGYWNGSNWDIMTGTVDTKAGTITFETNHFSAYAILYPGVIKPAVTTTPTTPAVTTTQAETTTTTTAPVITTTATLPPETQTTPEVITTVITKPATPTRPTTQIVAQTPETTVVSSSTASSKATDDKTKLVLIYGLAVAILVGGAALIIILRLRKKPGQGSGDNT